MGESFIVLWRPDRGKLLGGGGTKARVKEGDGWQMMTRQKARRLVGTSCESGSRNQTMGRN